MVSWIWSQTHCLGHFAIRAAGTLRRITRSGHKRPLPTWKCIYEEKNTATSEQSIQNLREGVELKELHFDWSVFWATCIWKAKLSHWSRGAGLRKHDLWILHSFLGNGPSLTDECHFWQIVIFFPEFETHSSAALTHLIRGNPFFYNWFENGIA